MPDIFVLFICFRRASMPDLLVIKILADAAPIFGVNTLFHIFVKSGKRPIFCRLHITVFHRVEMNVIHAIYKVFIIPYAMLPEALLPNAALAFLDFVCGFLHVVIMLAMMADITLDLVPAR